MWQADFGLTPGRAGFHQVQEDDAVFVFNRGQVHIRYTAVFFGERCQLEIMCGE